MKKFLYAALMLMAIGVTSCVKDDPYVEPEAPIIGDSDLKDKLVLNEVNGQGADADKYIELYNNSTTELDLAGVNIYYNNVSSEPAVTWTGTTEKLAAKAYLLLKGSKKGDYPGAGHALGTGLSGTQGINVEIRDADNNRIDLLTVPADGTRTVGCTRIPDGGDWYFDTAAGTPGAANTAVVTTQKPIVSVPTVANLARSVELPTSADDVEVSATVTVESGITLTSVVLNWTLNGAAQTAITMTASGDTYKGTIAKQVHESEITYTVLATNNKGGTASASGSYTVRDGDVAATKGQIYINECDPDAKQWELYNAEDFDINVGGWTMIKDNNDAAPFTFPAGTIIAAKSYYVMTQNADGHPTFGMSATKGFKYDLFNLEATTVDVFDNFGDNQFNDNVAAGYTVGRITDGSPNLVTFSVPSMGASNAEGTVDNAVDYSALVINEVDGNGKFVELYNKGDVAVPLTGLTIIKNEETEAAWWIGLEDAVIEPNGFYTIAQTSAAIVGATDYTGAGGISPKKAVQFELKDLAAEVIDVFRRCPEGEALDINITPDYGSTDPKYSFSRCPDGTGVFGLAVPSCNAANPATAAGEIETVKQ